MMSGVRLFLLAGVAAAMASAVPAAPGMISRWSFDGDNPGANDVSGAPEGRVEGASRAEGHEGKAMAFMDWSVIDYLRPDPRKATRVTVQHAPALNPPFPFRLSAWIYPTASPVFYGGIVEKGSGIGGSYGLILLRGLRPQAVLGDQHVVARASEPITLNAWHEVSMTADGQTLVLFVDGKEAARTSIPPGTKVASPAPLVIGERFTGRIDGVLISSE